MLLYLVVNNPPVFSSRRDRERPSSHRRRSRSSSSSSSPDRSIRRHTAPRRRRPPPSAEQEEQIKREAHSRSTFYILASLIKYYHIGMENSAAETSKSNKRNTEYRSVDYVFNSSFLLECILCIKIMCLIIYLSYWAVY